LAQEIQKRTQNFLKSNLHFQLKEKNLIHAKNNKVEFLGFDIKVPGRKQRAIVETRKILSFKKIRNRLTSRKDAMESRFEKAIFRAYEARKIKLLKAFYLALYSGEPGAMRVARRVLRGVLFIAPNLHHYVLSMGAVFSIFAGLYYWFEKLTGVQYSEFLSQLHFWVFFIGVNITFFPMHFLGVAGMPRRIPDYPDAFYIFNKIASWGSYISAFSLIIFALVLVDAFFSEKKPA
jgi:hypothetical protein